MEKLCDGVSMSLDGLTSTVCDYGHAGWDSVPTLWKQAGTCSIAVWCLECICHQIHYFLSVMRLTDSNIFKTVFVLRPIRGYFVS